MVVMIQFEDISLRPVVPQRIKLCDYDETTTIIAGRDIVAVIYTNSSFVDTIRQLRFKATAFLQSFLDVTLLPSPTLIQDLTSVNIYYEISSPPKN